MKHTKKSLLTIAAIAALSLLFVGCSETAAKQTATQEHAYVQNESSREDGFNRSSQRENATLANNAPGRDAVEAGSHGNGGSGEIEDCDSCDSVYTESGAYPSYTPSEADLALSLSGYGSAGALADQDLSLSDMLTYAISDEYVAHAEYALIMEEFGNVRPFANIIKAEQTHIDALLPLFAELGIAAPANDGAAHTLAASSLTEAFQAGVNAEVTNIAMYDLFLEQPLPAKVRAVFESLLRASENHLRAFQNRL